VNEKNYGKGEHQRVHNGGTTLLQKKKIGNRVVKRCEGQTHRGRLSQSLAKGCKPSNVRVSG